MFVLYKVSSWVLFHLIFVHSIKAMDNLPFINAFLTKAVSTWQDEVSSPIHADATLLLIGQLLDPAMGKLAGTMIFSLTMLYTPFLRF